MPSYRGTGPLRRDCDAPFRIAHRGLFVVYCPCVARWGCDAFVPGVRASAPGCGPGAGMLSSPNCAAYCALIHSYTGSMPFVKSAKLISILTSGVIVLASSSVRRKYLVE